VKLARPAIALAVSSTLALGGAAFAAVPKPKPVCNLVTDKAGDATGFVATGLPLPNDSYLDVLSADIATSTKKLAATIRLAAVGKDSTTVLDTYYVNFAVGTTRYFVSATYDGKTATYSAGDFSGTNGQRKTLSKIDGKVDAKKKTVSFSAPLSTWGINPKAVFSDLDVLGQRYLGNPNVGGATPTADEATSAKLYKGGTPSCLKA
jgi:hypothetical protein